MWANMWVGNIESGGPENVPSLAMIQKRWAAGVRCDRLTASAFRCYQALRQPHKPNACDSGTTL